MVGQARTRDAAVNLILALFLASAPIAVFYHAPLVFAHVVAEDFAGEYATAIAFCGAGVFFFYDALRAPDRRRTAVSLILGLAAIVIAGEEVSWAQRQLHYLFDVAAPDWVHAVNVQGEMNLHNLEGVELASRAYKPGSYLLLAWLASSALLFTVRGELAARLSTRGVPLVPLRLVPLCALPAFFFLLRPVAKSDEVGELLVGAAALAFALEWARSSGLGSKTRLPPQSVVLVLSLIVVGGLGAGLGALSPLGHMMWRLETLAARDYAGRGLYDQAKELFAYMHAHPTELLGEHTRLSHARVLAEAGDRATARRMLDAAISEREDDGAAASGDVLRRTGEVYAALGERGQAEKAFAVAIATDERALAQAGEADERARLLLSLSRTLSAQGRLDEARRMAHGAEETAILALTQDQIRRWQRELEEQSASRGSAP